MEGNALRRQLKLRQRSVFPDGTTEDGFRKEIGTWEWPILLKYRMPAVRGMHPFIEAGPSFRTRHDPVPGEPSQIGGTIGAGAEVRFGRFRVSPALRYTRWQFDGDFPRIATKRDQLEFLTGISYATAVSSWRLGSRKLRFGLIGGTPLTGGFAEMRQTEGLEEEQGYIGGLAVELDLSRRWSIKVNGLYRPLRAHSVSILEAPGYPSVESRFEFTVVTWQFPVLAKYRLSPDGNIHPLLEVGPSFRAAGNLNGYNPSRYGVTVGGGIETDYKSAKISPVLRYTRWAKDPAGTVPSARTQSNQVEVLVSFTF